ncbi:Membrane protein implicated in regulation of membrane protease activity [Micromonospora mirobrigensis]|uniref:Membrane protein implicated in regulation of membrane protease activity n=1 Tax=Micromonospora mirobrigensis TaxID=262898 RepID=A0A1C4X5G8_9ACTN|nr:Membrane protein implicated in regulation of membrane protease activity [Micromonospora mirobrigensis]
MTRASACHSWVVDAVVWIVLGVVLAVAEIFTTTLFLIMFAAGAFAAAGAAALGAPVAVQAVVFALVSALSVAVARPVIRRHSRSSLETGEQPFGVEAIEGSTALVLEAVDAEHGMVKIDGELWSARSFDATQSFAPGERVQVIKVRGATALVWQDDVSSPGQLPEAKR